MPRNYVSTTDSTTTGTNIAGLSDWYFDTTGTSAASTIIWNGWNTRYTTASATTNLLTRAEVRQPPPDRVYLPDRGVQRMAEIETAKSRAEGLLREHLTERQRSDLNEKNYFDVCAVDFKKATRRYYRIKRGRAGNVFELDGPHGREVRKYCCHPLEHVPDADTMLSQKLMIEFNEELFLKTANITDLRTGLFQQGNGLQAFG